nr:hypothetical protein Man4p_00105 [Serratia proteamaculans]
MVRSIYGCPGAGVNGIFLLRANLDAAFDDDGRQIYPLMARLTGDVAGVARLFDRSGWQVQPEGNLSLPQLYTLTAR